MVSMVSNVVMTMASVMVVSMVQKVALAVVHRVVASMVRSVIALTRRPRSRLRSKVLLVAIGRIRRAGRAHQSFGFMMGDQPMPGENCPADCQVAPQVLVLLTAIGMHRARNSHRQYDGRQDRRQKSELPHICLLKLRRSPAWPTSANLRDRAPASTRRRWSKVDIIARGTPLHTADLKLNGCYPTVLLS